MARDDFNVMYWCGEEEGPWSSGAQDRYVTQGCDGLVLAPGPEWSPSDLAFLHELPNLRYFALEEKVERDTEAFQIETLEELSLITGVCSAVPDVVQPRLRHLALNDRPGIDVCANWPALRVLRLGNWKGVDCRFLLGAPDLAVVHLEGRKQSVSFDGLEDCQELESLTVLNSAVADASALRALPNLTDLKLMAPKGRSHSAVDFSGLRTENLRKIWVSRAAELQGIAGLAGQERLREIRLIDCDLGPEASQSLEDLPSRIEVRIL